MTDRPHEHDTTPPNQAPGNGQSAGDADIVDLAAARAGRLPNSTPPPDLDGDAPVPDRPESARRTAARDTSYEIELDEPPTVDAAPVPVDLPESATPATPPVEGRRPVIPTGLHRANLSTTVRSTLDRWAHIAAFHTVRTPWYLLQVAWWAAVGLLRLASRQLRWWWVNEQ